MDAVNRAIYHIQKTAECPSFSSYEERLHPYIHEVFGNISGAFMKDMPGKNLVYGIPGSGKNQIALTAHLDKINHYGTNYPNPLPFSRTSTYLKGAMDDAAGLGILLLIAELTGHRSFPDLWFFFSEMEEKKGLKEHPEMLRNEGKGYQSGMGAKRIAGRCLKEDVAPAEVITLDTTPLFKGEPGVALYSRHWELNGLDPSEELIQRTHQIEDAFLDIDSDIRIDNNTNDYLHYGFMFNESGTHTVPSVALEPSIFPYHQQGEQVFIEDIERVLNILTAYLEKRCL